MLARLDRSFLSSFRLYRRLRGGHWERWHVQDWIDGVVPITVEVWLRRRDPNHLYVGEPVVEDYRSRGERLRLDVPEPEVPRAEKDQEKTITDLGTD